MNSKANLFFLLMLLNGAEVVLLMPLRLKINSVLHIFQVNHSNQ